MGVKIHESNIVFTRKSYQTSQRGTNISSQESERQCTCMWQVSILFGSTFCDYNLGLLLVEFVLFMFNAIFLEPNSLVSMIPWWSWKMRFWYLSMYWNLQVQRMELIPGIRLCAWIYKVYTCMFGSLLDLVWGLGLWFMADIWHYQTRGGVVVMIVW
jgi:hypothetical protein